jgi:ferredoxin-NADP reductase
MREATVTDVTTLTPDVTQFRLVDDEPFEYDPGQHTAVHVPADEHENDDEVVRPYTATSRPGTESITLAIRRYDDGTASTYMHDREEGDGVTVEDVDGNLYLRDLDADVLFAASGTGLTPLFPMLRQYARDGSGHAHLLYGEKTEEDLIYRAALDRLAAEHDDVSVTYVLSREDWDRPTGHVQEHLDAVDALEERDCYVCGVPEMVTDTTDRLTAHGVDDDRVYTEGWEADAVDD